MVASTTPARSRCATSSVDDNDAAFQGGGIYNGSNVATDAPTLALVNTSVDGNTAANVGGGIVTIKGATLTATGGHVNGNSAIGGGGVYRRRQRARIFDGTDFVDNTASASGGGAVLNSGTTDAHPRDCSARTTRIHTTGNTGLGGAIYSGSNNNNIDDEADGRRQHASRATTPTPLPRCVTFSPGTGVDEHDLDRPQHDQRQHQRHQRRRDRAVPPADHHQQHDHRQHRRRRLDGGLYMVVPSTVRVAGTIIGRNSGGSCSSAPVDGGYNLVRPRRRVAAGSRRPSNDVAATPQLGPLANNGGPTPTRLPGPTSPALDRIPAGTATG